MLINNKNIGYSKEANVLGAIVGINLLDDTVTLIDENDKVHVLSIDEVVELQEVGDIDGILIYEGDVVKVTDTGKLYEVIVLHDEEVNEKGEKFIAMHLLENNFKRKENGQGLSFNRLQLASFKGVLELVGNAEQLRQDVKTVDFNLAVFRKFVGGEVTYYYAGNDKAKQQVDLIKVLFVGHHIITEEEYERTTFSHEQFLEMVESGLLKEVNPMEVANYVMGLSHGKTPVATVETDAFPFANDAEDESEDEESTEDNCEDCDYPTDECECELW